MKPKTHNYSNDDLNMIYFDLTGDMLLPISLRRQSSEKTSLFTPVAAIILLSPKES